MTGQAAGGDTWSPTTEYSGGDSVIYNGITYVAQWWIQGETPGTAAVWVEETTGEIGNWSANKAYVAGDEVIFEGNNYRAKWWTKGNQPGDVNDSWERI